MTDTAFGLDVLLGTTPLRIAVDEDGAPQYEEEDVVGAEVVNPQDGQQFGDVFTTWHKGGFIAEHVQDGFYFDAENVDCTRPGEIRPGPRRVALLDFGLRHSTLAGYGVSGFSFDPVLNQVMVLVRKEAAAPDDLPVEIRSFWVTSAHNEDTTQTTDNTALHNAVADRTGQNGMTNLTPPFIFVRASTFEHVVPLGSHFRPLTPGALGPLVALGCHRFLQGSGRLFKVSISAAGFVQLSNCDQNAAYTTVGNWTTDVTLPAYDALGDVAAGIGLVVHRGVPYAGTPQGLFALGPGGIPFNLTPAYERLSGGSGNFAALRAVGAGVLAGLAGEGNLSLINLAGAHPVGPSRNPLAVTDKAIIMDIQLAPTGAAWVLIWYPGRSPEVWQVWLGLPSEGAAYAWHPLLTQTGLLEGGPRLTGDWSGAWRINSCPRPLFPVEFTASGTKTRELVLGGGHSPATKSDAGTANAAVTAGPGQLTDTRENWTVNEWLGYVVTCNGFSMLITGNTSNTLLGTAGWASTDATVVRPLQGAGNPGNGFAWTIHYGRNRVLFLDGDLFFGNQTYAHENAAVGYTPTVRWRSGRFSRHDPRVQRHWTRMRFLGKNISAGSGVGGGRIRVEVSLDGGAFQDPSGAPVHLTSNDQAVDTDFLAYDIEVRLTWPLDGAAATMRDTPATVTRIMLEGREVPNNLRRLSMIVLGDQTAQAGGVRGKRGTQALRTLINDSYSTAKQTFRDPFRASRTVQVLRGTKKLSLAECKRLKVPEGSVRVILLEAP